MTSSRRAALSAALALTATGCLTPPLPAGVECAAAVRTAHDAASLTEALAAAQPGDCVVLEDGGYPGSFVVPAGVKLIGAEGATARVLGQSGERAALELDAARAQGARTELWNVSVEEAPGNAIAVRGPSARLVDVSVVGAGIASVAIRCEDTDCFGDDGVELEGCTLASGAVGLWASGADVRAQDTEVREHTGDSLTGGGGVFAVGGARLSLEAVRVEDNDYGVVVDGEGGTRAELAGVVVRGNRERGVWAQRLRGSLAEPALRVFGSSEIVANQITGLGLTDSVGVVVEDSLIAETVLSPVTVDVETTVDIGDGVGLFAGSGAVRLEAVTLRRNQRSQAVVDRGGAGISLVNPTVERDEGQLAVVVQNTAEAVDAPPEVLEGNAPELAVSAPFVLVPDALVP